MLPETIVKKDKGIVLMTDATLKFANKTTTTNLVNLSSENIFNGKQVYHNKHGMIYFSEISTYERQEKNLKILQIKFYNFGK